MKRILISVVTLGIVVTGNAQQLHTTSFYEVQGIIHNPSMAGSTGKGMIGATYRSQWSGISGAPKTATIFGSIALPEHNIGLGGYLYNDKTGPTSRTGIQLAFAKHVPVGNGGKFSLGIEARAQQYSIDREKLAQTIGADPAFGDADNKFKFDAGFGISFTNDKFQVGASVSQLIQSKLAYYTGSLSTTEEGRLYRHYYLHGSYKWTIDETVITPNFLMIYLPNAPLDLQGGVRVEHNQLFWWGVGYRAQQSFMLSAGLNVNKKYTIGYSFDIYKDPVSTFDAGGNAHEILLKYNFSK